MTTSLLSPVRRPTYILSCTTNLHINALQRKPSGLQDGNGSGPFKPDDTFVGLQISNNRQLAGHLQAASNTALFSLEAVAWRVRSGAGGG